MEALCPRQQNNTKLLLSFALHHAVCLRLSQHIGGEDQSKLRDSSRVRMEREAKKGGTLPTKVHKCARVKDETFLASEEKRKIRGSSLNLAGALESACGQGLEINCRARAVNRR